MCRVLWPLVGLTLVTAPLIAQDDGMPLRINLSGTASAPVAAGGTVLGRATPGTPFSVLPSALNLGKGARAGLMARTSGSETTLEVAPIEAKDECDKDEACRFVLDFSWAETPDLALDPTLRYAVQRPSWPGGPGFPPIDEEKLFRDVQAARYLSRYRLDLGYQFSSFTKAEEIAGDQPGIVGTSADKTGSGIRVGAGYQFTPNVGVGVRYVRSEFSVTQEFPGMMMYQNDVTVTSYESVVRLSPLRGGQFTPYFGLGWGWFCNESEISSLGELLGTRGEGGGRVLGEVGTNLWLGGGFSGDVGLGYATGGGGDADTNLRYYVGLTYQFRLGK